MTTDLSRHERNVGVVGLGLMGTAITERLLAHGYGVHIWNRSREKADALITRGAIWSDNPLAECQRVIVSLYSSDVVASVVDQFQSALRPEQLLIDTTTGEPEAAVRLADRLAALGVGYLDAPISGSSEQTRQGEALVMVGGARQWFDACVDLWPVLGRSVFYTGTSGSASRMKLVSNLVLGLNRAALAEGLAFARASGVDPRAALELLKASAAYSRVMDIKGEKMLSEEFSVQARLSQHFKDVRIILEVASTTHVELPLSQTHAMLLQRAESLGCGELDNSAIIKVYGSPDNE